MPKRRLACLLLCLSTPPLWATGEVYCCQDSLNGRRVCGDTPPEACQGRPYRVLDSAGNVIKEIGPSLTPEQKAGLALEAVQKKKVEAANREQRQKDQALLDTYATPQDIDLSQSKAENDVNLAMATAQDRIKAARLKRNKLEREAEFYKKKAMPAELERDLHGLDHEIKVQQELLDVKKHDFDAIKAKFDADRKRYYELTGRSPKAAPNNGAPTTTLRPR